MLHNEKSSCNNYYISLCGGISETQISPQLLKFGLNLCPKCRESVNSCSAQTENVGRIFKKNQNMIFLLARNPTLNYMKLRSEEGVPIYSSFHFIHRFGSCQMRFCVEKMLNTIYPYALLSLFQPEMLGYTVSESKTLRTKHACHSRQHNNTLENKVGNGYTPRNT